MRSERRLANLYCELTGLGLPCLVMGGHAVRSYGVDRTTVDFDIHVALDPEAWKSLPATLSRSELLGGSLREGPSWRPDDFRRFVIGTLPDGREERLELWRSNHLLAPFPDLWSRRSVGEYGGGTVAFLGMEDLIRSKETERDDDWRDVALLEEIADERWLAAARDDLTRLAALAAIRSRRGYERAAAAGLYAEPGLVQQALTSSQHPLPRAYLLPHAPPEDAPSLPDDPITKLLAGPLREVKPGSARHLALVEAVRRLYRAAAIAADRRDKLSRASRTA